MIRNYFKIALRNIQRYPVYSILNITGLAIGMTCSILLLIWVQYQFSYDRFHKNADYLFRVLVRNNADGESKGMALTMYPLSDVLKEEFPEIIRSSRYQNFWETFPKGDDIVEGSLATVDKDFLDMFNFGFIQGDKKSALTGPYDIIITEDMAERYFGDEDPLGKSMTVWPDNLFTVAGVIKNVPRNSHFYIDCIVSSEFLHMKNGMNLKDWKNASNYTFIELARGADSKSVEGKIKNTIQRNMEESESELFLQNLKKIHLYSRGQYAMDIERGNITQVRIAILVASLILTIACVNFMNMFTALSSGRYKEIGLRKIAGADKYRIMLQFLGESLIVVTVSMAVAMILVELLLPGFNNLMLMETKINYKSPGIYAGLITIVLACGLLAGTYPALYLSSLEPMKIMKGMIFRNTGYSRFRKILVITQFTLAFMFIICTLIIRSQLNYVQNKNFGVNIKNIGHFEFTEGITRETLRNEISRNPDIESITITDHQWVVNNWSATGGISWEGKKESEEVTFSLLLTDSGYANTFGLELTEGKFLNTDESSTGSSEAVINERAAKIMGLDDPVGKILSTTSGDKFTIIGVVKDFHFKSFHFAIDPLIIVPIHESAKGGRCYIRMKPDNIPSTVKFIRNIFKTHNLDYALALGFVEDNLNDHYRIEQIAGTVFSLLAVLAIVISCLGLIGLSAFMTIRRTKEIGIRKVNGSESAEIFTMLLKEHTKLILISFTIACPISFLIMNIWLQGFAFRINMNWWLFALAWIIVMVITILAVGFQSYKAAMKNPVEALRYE
ncbi:MAG: ABC transporter permease [Bacteroidota bacterium]